MKFCSTKKNWFNNKISDIANRNNGTSSMDENSIEVVAKTSDMKSIVTEIKDRFGRVYNVIKSSKDKKIEIPFTDEKYDILEKRIKERKSQVVNYEGENDINIAWDEQQKLLNKGPFNYFKKDPSNMFSPSLYSKSIKEVNLNDVKLIEPINNSRLDKIGIYEEPEYTNSSRNHPVLLNINGVNYLLDGHHRVTAAKNQGIKSLKFAVKNYPTLVNSESIQANYEGGNNNSINSESLSESIQPIIEDFNLDSKFEQALENFSSQTKKMNLSGKIKYEGTGVASIDLKTNDISVNKDKVQELANKMGLSYDQAYKLVVLHEINHALFNRLGPEQLKAAKVLYRKFLQANKEAPYKDRFRKNYNLTFEEFLTESISNPLFAQYLAGVKVGETNLLDKLIQFFLKLIGITPDSNLKDAMSALYQSNLKYEGIKTNIVEQANYEGIKTYGKALNSASMETFKVIDTMHREVTPAGDFYEVNGQGKKRASSVLDDFSKINKKGETFNKYKFRGTNQDEVAPKMGDQLEDVFNMLVMEEDDSWYYRKHPDNYIEEGKLESIKKEIQPIVDKLKEDYTILLQVKVHTDEYAGTADVVLIDSEGKVSIYDVKSSVAPTATVYEKKDQKGETRRGSFTKPFKTLDGVGASKAERYSGQMSLYAAAFINRGIQLNEMSVIPIYINPQPEEIPFVKSGTTQITGVKVEPLVRLKFNRDFKSAISEDADFDINEEEDVMDFLFKEINKTIANLNREITVNEKGIKNQANFDKNRLEGLRDKLQQMKFTVTELKQIEEIVNALNTIYLSENYGIEERLDKLVKSINSNNLESLQEFYSIQKEIGFYDNMIKSINTKYQLSTDEIEDNSLIDKFNRIKQAHETANIIITSKIIPKLSKFFAEGVTNNIKNTEDYKTLERRTLAYKKEYIDKYLNGDESKFKEMVRGLKVLSTDTLIKNPKQAIDDYIKINHKKGGPLLKRYLNEQYNLNRLLAQNVTEESISDILEGTTEYDIGFFEKWLSAPINMQHPLIGLFAKKLKHKLEVVRQENLKLEDEFREFHKKIGHTDDVSVNDKFLELSNGAWKLIESKDYNKIVGVEEIPDYDEVIKYKDKELVVNKGKLTLIKEKRIELKSKYGKDNPIVEKELLRWISSQTNEYAKKQALKGVKGYFYRPDSNSLKFNSMLENVNGEYKAKNKNGEQYLFMLGHYLDAQKTLIDSEKMGLNIPYMSKSSFDTYKESLPLYVLKKYEDITKYTEDERALMLNEDKKNPVVPLLYSSKIDPNKVSKDIMSTILIFKGEVNKRNAKKELESVANLTKANLNKNSPEKNFTKVFDAFVDMQIYGNLRNGAGKLDKAIDTLMAYSSFIQIGGNPIGSFINTVSGTTQNIISSFGKEYFDSKTLASANLEFDKQSLALAKDALSNTKESFLTRLIDLYDPLQGEGFDKFGRKVSMSGRKANTNKGIIFMLQNIGEHKIQVSAMIAYLKSQPYGDSNLYEYYKAQFKKNGQLPNINHLAHQDKIHTMNKKLNGVYNKFDANLVSRNSLGRTLMMYRKWIYPLMYERYGNLRYNNESNDLEYGYYRSSIKILLQRFKNLFQESIHEDLTEIEQRNLNKFYTEQMIIISLLMLGYALKEATDEEDLKAIKYTISRIRSELSFFSPIVPYPDLGAYRTLRSPSASLTTMENVIRLINQMLDPTETYKTDGSSYKKGDSKLLARIYKLLGVNPAKWNPERAQEILDWSNL